MLHMFNAVRKPRIEKTRGRWTELAYSPQGKKTRPIFQYGFSKYELKGRRLVSKADGFFRNKPAIVDHLL